MEELVKDTIFANNHLIITHSDATVISYVDITAIISTVFIALFGIIILIVLFNFLKAVDKLYDKSFKRSANLLKGLIGLIGIAWLINLFCLITIPNYTFSHVLIYTIIAILIYEFIKVIVNLGNLGLSSSKLIKIIASGLKAAATKNADSVADMLTELSEDEAFVKGKMDNTDNNTSKKLLSIALFIIIPVFFLSGTKTGYQAFVHSQDFIIEQYTEVKVETYRLINIERKGEIIYQIKWIKLEPNQKITVK